MFFMFSLLFLLDCIEEKRANNTTRTGKAEFRSRTVVLPFFSPLLRYAMLAFSISLRLEVT